ncbi:hypothetical protein [Salinarimonas ramus]|nr:hypothetical protein [Salinarimonas ramus]
MSEIAYRFCTQATIVALLTLVVGIAVALDAIGSSRGCPPLATMVEACADASLVPPTAAGLGEPTFHPLRRG